MRAKKWLTIITFICVCAGLFLVFHFNFCRLKLGYDIALAIFGSAVLGFIMSFIEYLAEREKAMATFWQEAQAILREFRKLKPLCVDEPEELLLASFAEEESNKEVDQYSKHAAGLLRLSKKHDSRSNMMAWLEENEYMSFDEYDDVDSILLELYNKRIKSEYKKIESAFKAYVDFSEISLTNLDNAYGNLDFMFDNMKIRKRAYDMIFNRMRSIRNLVAEKAYFFRLYPERKGSFVNCAKKVFELNRQFFVYKDEQVGENTFKFIYQQAFDEIEDELEAFRVKIYLKSENETKEHYPVVGSMVMFEDNEKKDA